MWVLKYCLAKLGSYITTLVLLYVYANWALKLPCYQYLYIFWYCPLFNFQHGIRIHPFKISLAERIGKAEFFVSSYRIVVNMRILLIILRSDLTLCRYYIWLRVQTKAISPASSGVLCGIIGFLLVYIISGSTQAYIAAVNDTFAM